MVLYWLVIHIQLIIQITKLNKNSKISHYNRKIGHSNTSIKLFSKLLNNEKSGEYEYENMKKYCDYLDIYYTENDMKTITNCFMFAIRSSKCLDISTTIDIDIPYGIDIVDWTLGIQEWKQNDKFKKIWDYSKDNANTYVLSSYDNESDTDNDE